MKPEEVARGALEGPAEPRAGQELEGSGGDFAAADGGLLAPAASSTEAKFGVTPQASMPPLGGLVAPGGLLEVATAPGGPPEAPWASRGTSRCGETSAPPDGPTTGTTGTLDPLERDMEPGGRFDEAA
ncbi:MAG TPA: hypothetical protein DIU15_18885 [Deltaproteobacteria bacterium]|nr:hypothetical protein [Deltaproteobacteria bacterium]HCP48112.1 hypothetical protein [Deltaproteobacteria bacterium]